MMPEEWPIAAPAPETATPAHPAGRSRLRTVRIDFFLRPEERLSEQERALMTAMLHCLVEDVATEIRARLPGSAAAANDDDDSGVVDTLVQAGLLDDPELIALLLERAVEERIGSAARARSGRREARAIQALVSHDVAEVSAAAMGVILARGRRRNRFGQCLLAFEDLPPPSAERLANAIAAALSVAARSPNHADAPFAAAAAEMTEGQGESRSAEALAEALVRSLQQAGALSDDLLLACAQEGELGFIATSAAVQGQIPLAVASGELLSGDEPRIARLMRAAGFSRALSAGILASIGDLLGIQDPGAAIGHFDAIDEAQLAKTRAWLSAAPSYRAAVEALGGAHG